LVLVPELVRLSEEAERKLADERMEKWSKDHEEYAEGQHQETQRRRAARSRSAEKKKVPIPSIQEIEKEAEVERAKGVITSKESRESGEVAPSTDRKLDHPQSKESV
jgi:hypothetical protein